MEKAKTKSAEVLSKLAAQMEDKMNKKLEKILGKLAEQNPSLNINVKELLAVACVEGEGETATDGEEGVEQGVEQLGVEEEADA